MSCNGAVHQWSGRDRLVYLATLAPFVVAFVGAAYVLSTFSVYLTLTFVLLYVALNVFQAGCCIGCPYRGKFCPAVFGMYSANVISASFYGRRTHDPRFFRVNANLAEVSLAATLVFPIYWLAESNWVYAVAFLALAGLHAVTFFPAMCLKCGYNDTCPGGQTTAKLLKKRVRNST